jgi:hypothetical protein
MNQRQKKLDVFTFAGLFGLALFVRLLNLGGTPLSEFEAGWALQSWVFLKSGQVHIGPNPGYFSLTTILFYLFGSNNVLARFWPVLAGSLIVWIPFGFRRFIGREAALIMAFGLVLDPGMVSVSRIAGGPMMALGFSGLSLVFLARKHPVWAGILGGAGLVSGPAIFLGIMGFLFSYWLAHQFGFSPTIHFSDGSADSSQATGYSDIEWRKGLLSALVTVLLIGTLFTRFPAGLSAWGSSLATFLQGWTQAPTVPVFQPVLALVFYQPFALIFALITVGRGWLVGKNRDRWLSIWLLMALSITVVYSQRAVYDAIWAFLPLWALASIELARYCKIPQAKAAAFGQTGLLVVLGVIMWLVSVGPGLGEYTLLVLLVIPVLGILTTIFIGLGWSWDAARSGAVWGISLLLGAYLLSATFSASQLKQNSPVELWYPLPGTGQAEYFRETLGELALIETGRKDWIQTVSLTDSQSLRWLLREVNDVRYVSELEPSNLPAIIITPADGADLSQTMSYRGQDFLWSTNPNWTGALPQPLWPWVASRQAATRRESIVMWARSDLFPEESVPAEEDAVLVPSQLDNQVEDNSLE